MTFEKFGLSEPVLKALQATGYTTPTPIQQQAIPLVLNRSDLLGCAQTGTGKTAAFAIPTLEILSSAKGSGKGYRHIRALVLTPTRELAIQINDSFAEYGKFTGLKQEVIFGGVSQHPQTKSLQEGTDILIATPGRLLDLMNQGYIYLDHLEIFVLDEADRMLDMGFIHDVKKVIRELPEQRQTLLFSATMPGPISQLADSLLHNPEKVAVDPVCSTVDKIEQAVFMVHAADKQPLLEHILKQDSNRRTLVFARTKWGADKIAKNLNKAHIRAESLHGDKPQAARQWALQNFKNGRLKVLVATDIAARGIDIDNLTHVINFDLPNIPETYVHRIGRTGRAGAAGIALSFCDGKEKAYLKDINKATGQSIAIVDHPFQKATAPQQNHPRPKKGPSSKQHNNFHRRKNQAAAV
ncbi:MAG: DEAD/DEAH box helicase [Williamsia sp.]|nr:DEAD/DEAH box helicase [Williamsia sp.]